MIEGDLSELSEAEIVAAARSQVRARIQTENDLLRSAAEFAARHNGDSIISPESSGRLPIKGERAVTLGGAGTPKIAEFAPKTFGLETGMSPGRAQSTFAAVLDLQHRLPRLWRQVCGYRVEAWLACKVARHTRDLPYALVREVDERIEGRLSGISWDRCRDITDAETINADPERAERLAREALAYRCVRVGQSNEHGTKTIYSRMSAADAIRFDATVDRLADILSAADQSPTGVNPLGASTKDEWRSVAQGVMGLPLLAARILLDHEQPDLLTEVAAELGLSTETDIPYPADPPLDPAEQPNLVQSRPRPTNEELGRALRTLIRSLDPEKFLPPVDLYVHIARAAITGHRGDGTGSASPGEGPDPAVARVEELGPAVLAQVRDWLGTGCRVRLRPVLDLADVRPVDQYEVPPRMREALQLITPTSVFPYSGHRSRRMQADHAIPFRRRSSNDPPRLPQTGVHNLGWLVIGEHRYRTFGPVQLRQPVPGVRVWRTRYGTVLIDNDSGTHELGSDPFAQAVWEAARRLNPALMWYHSIMVANAPHSAAEACWTDRTADRTDSASDQPYSSGRRSAKESLCGPSALLRESAGSISATTS